MDRRFLRRRVTVQHDGNGERCTPGESETQVSGEVLLYPYYTVSGNQDHYLVANNSYRGIVAKVRFLEGRRGRPVLDFNLYLSAHDSWAAVVSQTADNGGAMLNDRSQLHDARDPDIGDRILRRGL